MRKENENRSSFQDDQFWAEGYGAPCDTAASKYKGKLRVKTAIQTWAINYITTVEKFQLKKLSVKKCRDVIG